MSRTDFRFICRMTMCVFTTVMTSPVLAGPMQATSRPADTRIAPLPQAVASFGAVVDGNWLYVLGGHTGEQHHHSSANLSSLFMRLNLLDRTTWEILPGGVGLQSVSLVAHKGQLYRVGGMRPLNASGETENLQSVADVACYDPVANAWKPATPLPEARSSHDAIVYNGRLYVAGGWLLNGASDKATWLKSAYLLDLRSQESKWEALPEQPFQRRAVALSAARDRLCVIGGIAPDGKPSSAVDVLDLKAGRWTKGPDFPGNGFGLSAITVEDRIYVSGLEGKLYRLSEDGKTWEDLNNLRFPRIFHRLVCAGEGELLAVGGAGKGGHLRVIESVALSSSPRPPVVQTWTLPWPGHARNRQGVFLNQEELSFFGGNNSLEQHDFEPENFVEEGLSFNVGAIEIERRQAFPARRQSMVTAVVGDATRSVGYALGGFGHDGQVAHSFADIYRYDFKKKEWETAGCKLPSPLTQFALASRGSELWLFGGLDYDPRREKKDQFRHSSAIYVWDTFDEKAGFKAIKQTLTQPRRAFGCATIADRVYIVGGMRENFKLVEPCDVFNLSTRTWETIPSPRAPRISPELVALGGKLYLIGGSSPDADKEIVPNDSIEVYDPAAKKWAVFLEHLPVPSKHLRAFALRDQLLLASTHDDNGVLRVMMLRPEAEPAPAVSQR